MSKFNPEKLSVNFRDGITTTEPIIGRHYTLTHSDKTAELFLTIGLKYAYDDITPMRDEVLGKWINTENQYVYLVHLHVDGNAGIVMTSIRNSIFRRELPLALEAICYGDRTLFNTHPKLYASPIIVYFNSAIPYFNKVEKWGSFSKYVVM